MDPLYQLKYPIGKYEIPSKITDQVIESWISDIEKFPSRLRSECANLSSDQLEWTYRPGGWNIRQLVHHCADSHTNSIIRFKWAMTEDTPRIKAYHEARWAELPDYAEGEIGDTLVYIEYLHKRWTRFLRLLSWADLQRKFIHPETEKTQKLSEVIGLYAWHCNHHLAHIDLAIQNH